MIDLLRTCNLTEMILHIRRDWSDSAAESMRHAFGPRAPHVGMWVFYCSNSEFTDEPQEFQTRFLRAVSIVAAEHNDAASPQSTRKDLV